MEVNLGKPMSFTSSPSVVTDDIIIIDKRSVCRQWSAQQQHYHIRDDDGEWNLKGYRKSNKNSRIFSYRRVEGTF